MACALCSVNSSLCVACGLYYSLKQLSFSAAIFSSVVTDMSVAGFPMGGERRMGRENLLWAS